MKLYAIAKLVSQSEVSSRLSSFGDTYVNGMIFVEIPELGFQGKNLILCRYGLSIPYLKVKKGQPLWVEPTIGDNERYVYVGFAEPMKNSYGNGNSIVLFDSGDLNITIEEGGNIIIKNNENQLEIKPSQTDASKDLVHTSTRTAFSDGFMTAFGPTVSRIPNAHPVT
ncbi:hypothetical protein [Leptospira idonii]|uniref:Uncharacterized protein n=1 Tax=Leptospira idonii TaxID=1193500 RepID=A0A4R9M3Y8_9LEPT|nr:hypothetical protein [Leptospira idonii]TGN20822.1 hypothetical protein EHS15_01935 [Leptospira idonii]